MKKADPLAALMTRKTAVKKPAKAPEEIAKIMSEFRELKAKYEEQQALIEMLERDAKSDPLTNLANRRTFEDELERSLATARRYGRHHALLVIDVNDFKSINDRLGHSMGDQVLQHIARLLRQNIRPTDIAARYGGDEFCVILNELRAIENAEMRAQSLSDIISRTPCVGEKHTVHVGASVGVCVFGADDEAADIFQRADTNMYEQKQKHSA
ncbi:MAG TPA: GGDEF domain-containing protein [Alphaproteobacteria bacterium]|nr:GGDEF domain-containing protein [Alphaproteobacteria bacterium]